ncbi:MAG: hypothetical protein ACTSRG_20460 [Candidatus Helarchaeota archaeon]
MVKKVTNAKWMAMGIIGLSMIVGGVSSIIMSRFFPFPSSNMYSSQIISSIMMFFIMGESLGITIEQYLIIFVLPTIIRTQNIIRFIMSVLLILGVSICSAGGILAAVGWTKYYKLEAKK